MAGGAAPALRLRLPGQHQHAQRMSAPPPPSAFADAAAGALGGACGVFFGHPLDTLRVRLQQPGARSLASVLAATPLRASLQGVSAPLAFAAFQNSAFFSLYGQAAHALGGNGGGSSKSQTASLGTAWWAGCAAGAVTALLATPFELVKCRLQVASASDAGAGGALGGPLRLARSIVTAEGPLGLWRGAWSTVLRDTPASGAYVVVYAALSSSLVGGDGDSRDCASATAASTLLAGGAAGVASWLLVYPADVVKSRLQAAPPGTYAGVVDCAVRSVRADGWAVLSRGLGTCLARAFLVNAAIFGGYEAGLALLRRREEGRE